MSTRHEKPRGTKRGGAGPVPVERLKAVRALMAECWSNHRIEHALSEKFDCTRRTIGEYIRRVERDMADETAAMKDTYRERMREANEELFRVCKAEKKYAQAAMCIDRLARLSGSYVDRVELSGPSGGAMALEVKTEISLTDWSPADVALLKRALLGSEK